MSKLGRGGSELGLERSPALGKGGSLEAQSSSLCLVDPVWEAIRAGKVYVPLNFLGLGQVRAYSVLTYALKK